MVTEVPTWVEGCLVRQRVYCPEHLKKWYPKPAEKKTTTLNSSLFVLQLGKTHRYHRIGDGAALLPGVGCWGYLHELGPMNSHTGDYADMIYMYLLHLIYVPIHICIYHMYHVYIYIFVFQYILYIHLLILDSPLKSLLCLKFRILLFHSFFSVFGGYPRVVSRAHRGVESCMEMECRTSLCFLNVEPLF